MAEVEAAAQGHNQLKMLGDSSSIRYEDALQRCWSLLRSLHEIIINALRLSRRSRASRSLTKTGLYFCLLGFLGRSERHFFFHVCEKLPRRITFVSSRMLLERFFGEVALKLAKNVSLGPIFVVRMLSEVVLLVKC